MASVSRVLVTRKLPEAAIARLTGASIGVEMWPHEDTGMPHADMVAKAKDVDGILCLLSDRVDKEVIEAAGASLKVVSTLSAGHDHVDLAECNARGVKVGHTPGVLSNATAELAVGLLMSVTRRIVESARSAADGGWGTWCLYGYCGGALKGKTVGIVGLGGIGAATARILAGGFGCRILYCGPREKADVAATIPGGATYVPFDELLKESDVVSLHCPATPDTLGLFNAETFGRMKSSAYFINTARGGMVNQDDLVAALKDGVIAGAGLDVTTPEPLPPSHPLFSTPNCVVLPHIGSADTPTRTAILDLGMDNLLAGLSGSAMPHCANP